MITPSETNLDEHYGCRSAAATGLPWDVFVSRTGGEAVVLMHELPGLTPAVVSLGDSFRRADFRVYMPSLLGNPGRMPGVLRQLLVGAIACIRSDIQAFRRADTTRPVVQSLQRLVDMASAENGGGKVGVIGLCLTGGFALALATNRRVSAAVASEPSLPLFRDDGIDLDTNDQRILRERTRSGELTTLLLRFQSDRLSGCARVRRYADVMEGRIAVRCLPDSSVDPAWKGPARCHSVLTNELVEAPGEITLAARDEVIAHFNWRLRGGPPPMPDPRIPDCVQAGCVARRKCLID